MLYVRYSGFGCKNSALNFDVEYQFTARVTQLTKLTESHQVDRFKKCPVEAVVLARLGRFLTDLANFNQSEAVKPTSNKAISDKATSVSQECAS